MTDSDSVLSVGTKTDDLEDAVADLSNAELAKVIEEIKNANEVLRIETDMLEKFNRRVSFKENKNLSSASNSPMQVGQEAILGRGRSRKISSRATKTVYSEALLLTPDQKCDIAQRELEELQEELEKLRRDTEKIMDIYKAMLEETDIRMIELKKATYEFERDICKLSVHSRTKKVMGEKVVRYFEEKNKWRESLIEKLRLKNSTLRIQKKKVAVMLKQKEEMGEILHEVDFQQLKIENTQFLEKIDEKNQDLLRLKLMAGNTLQILAQYRKRMNALTCEELRLHYETKAKKENLAKFIEEIGVVETERACASQINHELRRRLSNFRVPHVQEYVDKKSLLRDLRKTVRSWERKVDIVQMALENHKKAWQKIWLEIHEATWGRPSFQSSITAASVKF